MRRSTVAARLALALLISPVFAAAAAVHSVPGAVETFARSLPPGQGNAALSYLGGGAADAASVAAAAAVPGAALDESRLAAVTAALAASASDPSQSFETARRVAELKAELKGLSVEQAAALEAVYSAAKAHVPEAMQTRLDSIAKALGRGAQTDAVAAPAGQKDIPAAGRLQPHSLTDEQLKAKIKATPRGLKEAIFTGAEYKPEYEPRLKALGADAIHVEDPTEHQLDALQEKDGYFLGTSRVRWVTPLPASFEEYVAAVDPNKPDGRWPAAKIRGHIRTELKKSKDVEVTVKKLTADEYREWYPIWWDEVGNKPGGYKETWKLEDAEKWAADPEAYMLMTRVGGQLVGGSVIKAWKEKGIVTIGAAAYKREFKGKHQLSIRTYAEMIKLATSLGFTVGSYGRDDNSYGYDFDIGLNNYKVSVGMIPYPEMKFRMMKLLNGDKLRAPELLNKDGKGQGYLIYAVKRDSELFRRYRASAAAGAPAAPEALLGGGYFGAETLRPEDTLKAVHITESDLPGRVTQGIEVERHALP